MFFKGIKSFSRGDRIVYVGPDKGGPTRGDVGTVMGPSTDLSTSVEPDSVGSPVYVVEYDREGAGYDCKYTGKHGKVQITKDRHG